MSLMKDEQGNRSAARLFLAIELGIVWLTCLLELFTGFGVSDTVWAMHGSLMIALVAWAAGPRGLQYLGPQIGRVAGAIRGGGGDARRTTVVVGDNPRIDDERD